MHRIILVLVSLAVVSCAHKKATDTAKGTTTPTEKVAATPAPKKMTKETASILDGITCRAGEDQRTIAKKSMTGGGCEVLYTKHGETNTIADAKNDVGYCDNVVDKIKNNLTSAGFNCQ